MTQKEYFITSAGLSDPVSFFAGAYNSLVLNFGTKYIFSKHYVSQFVLDFNPANYNQQVKDRSSAYLFKIPCSSDFLGGINLGSTFRLIPSGKLFARPYVDLGSDNIGEPRVVVNNSNGVISQQVSRMRGILERLASGLPTQKIQKNCRYFILIHPIGHQILKCKTTN